MTCHLCVWPSPWPEWKLLPITSAAVPHRRALSTKGIACPCYGTCCWRSLKPVRSILFFLPCFLLFGFYLSISFSLSLQLNWWSMGFPYIIWLPLRGIVIYYLSVCLSVCLFHLLSEIFLLPTCVPVYFFYGESSRVVVNDAEYCVPAISAGIFRHSSAPTTAYLPFHARWTISWGRVVFNASLQFCE